MKVETCPLCNGMGYRTLFEGMILTYWVLCPKCQGMGKIEVQEASQ